LDCLQSALRRPLLVCLPALVATLCALTVAFLLPARYRAAALVQVEWEPEAEGGKPPASVDLAGRGLEAVRGRILGSATIERVLRDLGPYRAATGESGPSTESPEAALAAVSVKPRGEDAFVIEYEHRDPARAALVSNRLASLLAEEAESERAKRGQADPALSEARLGEARKLLDDALEALRRRREAGSAAAPDESATAQRERLEAARRSVATALEVARARSERLRRAIAVEIRPPVAPGGAAAELDRLRAERLELLKRYTEEHPDVVALTVRIRRLEADVSPSAVPAPGAKNDALKAELGRVEAEIETLGRRSDALDAEIAGLASRAPAAGRLPPAADPGQELETLAGNVERAQAAYAALQEEQSAAEAAWRLSSGTLPRLRVLQVAPVPTRPYFPNRLAFGLVGLALGLAAGLGAALVAERRDPSVKGAEDLRALLPQPLLAEIPRVRVPRSSRRR
jgi:uncharacterized protein involved in exopolysaccharide biosynthesis